MLHCDNEEVAKMIADTFNRFFELLKENQDLNEELELVRCDLHNRSSELDGCERTLDEYQQQQKEFLEWLENEIKGCNAYSKYVKKKERELKSTRLSKTYLTVQMMKNEAEKECYKKSLSKFKEIIGDKDE